MACAVCGDNCEFLYLDTSICFLWGKIKLRRSPGYMSTESDRRLIIMQRIGNVPETPIPLAPMMVSLGSIALRWLGHHPLMFSVC